MLLCSHRGLKASLPVPGRISIGRPCKPVICRSWGGGQEPSKAAGSLPQVQVQVQRANSGALDEESPFFEPLLRNLILGISVGGLVELLHVCSSVVNTTDPAATLHLIATLAGAQSAALAPLWVLDHVVAIGAWALLYLIEAYSVSKIIEHMQDPSTAANAIRSTMTLPKRMLPMSMNAAKRSVYKLLYGGKLGSAAKAGASAGQPNAFTTGDFARELERRNRAGSSGSGRVSAGTSVLDRPAAGPGVLPRPPVKEPGPGQGQDDKGKDLPSPPEPMPEPGPTPTPTPPPSPTPKPDVNGPTAIPPPAPPVISKRGNLSDLLPKHLTAPGEKDEVGADDASKEGKREKELRERRAYLKNFWYAVGISEQLSADKPQEVNILGRTVVLFRDAQTGKVSCMENVCPHRGARLGQGWTHEVKGHTCVVCPYHAWAFDAEGRLQDVPSQAVGQLPKRPMLQTYPVEEKGGFIWLFFGSNRMPAEERPPIPYVPELEDPNWRAVYGEMEFNCPHWSTFDNALDFAHIHYVHDGSFGNPDKPEILDMHMERDTFEISGSFKIHNKPVNKLLEFTRVPYVPVEVKAFMPMTSAVKITLAGGLQMITFVNTIPIDEHRSINRFCLIRNKATSPLLDAMVRKEMYKILGEDKEIVETVRPDDIPVEYSLYADAAQIAFRKLRQEWVDMGYAVDPSATRGPKGSLNI